MKIKKFSIAFDEKRATAKTSTSQAALSMKKLNFVLSLGRLLNQESYKDKSI